MTAALGFFPPADADQCGLCHRIYGEACAQCPNAKFCVEDCGNTTDDPSGICSDCGNQADMPRLRR